jgi:hypothetical protein
MKFTFTREQEEFRKEIRDVLEAELEKRPPSAGGLRACERIVD